MREPMVNHMELHRLNSFTSTWEGRWKVIHLKESRGTKSRREVRR